MSLTPEEQAEFDAALAEEEQEKLKQAQEAAGENKDETVVEGETSSTEASDESGAVVEGEFIQGENILDEPAAGTGEGEQLPTSDDKPEEQAPPAGPTQEELEAQAAETQRLADEEAAKVLAKQNEEAEAQRQAQLDEQRRIARETAEAKVEAAKNQAAKNKAATGAAPDNVNVKEVSAQSTVPDSTDPFVTNPNLAFVKRTFETYILEMGPGYPNTKTTIVNNNKRLLLCLKNCATKYPKADFIAAMQYIDKVIRDNIEGAFAPSLVARASLESGREYVSWTQALITLSTTNKTVRRQLVNRFPYEKHFGEAAGRINEFYRNLVG